MKIVEVRATCHVDPSEDAGPAYAREIVLVEVVTDEGLTGLGFCPVPTAAHGRPLGPFLTSVVADWLTPLVVGKDSESVEEIWSSMYAGVAPRRGARGMLLWAIAAIDIALWDLRATRRGVPLCALFDGVRPSVATYTNLGHLSDPHVLADAAVGLAERGHRAFKIRGARSVGTPNDARRRVELIREAVGPDPLIMLDVNGSWDVDSAIAASGWMNDLGVHWLEEPVSPDDVTGYAEVRRHAGDVLIAGGEQHSGQLEFERLLGEAAVDVVQPGAIAVGGITAWMVIYRLAESMGIVVSPWNLQSVHVHLAVGLAGVRWIEYFEDAHGLMGFQHRLLRDGIRPALSANGIVIPAPTAAGLGLVVDPELAERSLIGSPR